MARLEATKNCRQINQIRFLSGKGAYYASVGNAIFCLSTT